MRRPMLAAALAVATLPVAALATFLLAPLWRWVESTLKIEAIGHSGPATWCFVAAYLALLLPSFLVWFFPIRKSRPSAPASGKSL